jgi:hypothetical protein
MQGSGVRLTYGQRRLAWMAPASALLLPLLWQLDDPLSNAGNPAFRPSVAGLATANAIAPDPPADAMEPRPGPER